MYPAFLAHHSPCVIVRSAFRGPSHKLQGPIAGLALALALWFHALPIAYPLRGIDGATGWEGTKCQSRARARGCTAFG